MKKEHILTTRRHFFLFAAAMLCVNRAVGVDSPIVQLLVVREGREPRKCGELRFTPGILYGVPSELDLDAVVPPLGLTRIGRVEELPYLGNTPESSAIPAGTYAAFVREDATKKWMTTRNRRWRIELRDVPGGRSAIQFHYGKDYSWSSGCVILTGDASEGLICRAEESTSEGVVQRLRDYVEAIGKTSPISLRVRLMYSG